MAKPTVNCGQRHGGGQKLAGCRAHGERQYAITRLALSGSQQQMRTVIAWSAPPFRRTLRGSAPAVCTGAPRGRGRAGAGRQVGEVVRVEGGGFFPADLLLLASSHAEGIAYVETLNLDGESNLKIKKALEATRRLLEEAVAGLQARAGALNLPH